MKLLPALLALLLAAPVCGVDADDRVDLTTPIERDLPPERNAYTIWKEVLPAFVLPDDSSLKDSLTQAVDYTRSMPSGPLNEKLTEWLDAHHEELTRLKRANLQERCQLPEAAMSDLLAFPVSASLTAGKVLVLIARSHAANGEYQKAVEAHGDALRFGKLICEAEGCMIHALVGRAVLSLGLSSMRETASRRETSAAVLGSLQRTVTECSPTREAMQKVVSAEYAFMDGAFKEDARRLPHVLRDHGVQTPGAFDPHATRLLLRDVMVRAARKLASPDRFRDELIPADVNVLLANRSVAGISDDFFSWWMIVGNNIELDVEEPDWHLMADHCAAHPNLIGLLYVAHEGDSVSGFINAFMLLRTETSLTRAYLLLRAHQLREKEWPAQLSDALPENPPPDAVLDYFSNQPLRYSRERGLLWSVGPDGTDNAGDPAKDMVLNLANPVKISRPQP